MDIHEDNIGELALNQCHSLLSTDCHSRHPIAELFHSPPDIQSDNTLVLDYQDLALYGGTHSLSFSGMKRVAPASM